MSARRAELQDLAFSDLCVDYSKSGHRAPLREGGLPTLVTNSKIFHFGLKQQLSGMVLMASQPHLIDIALWLLL